MHDRKPLTQHVQLTSYLCICNFRVFEIAMVVCSHAVQEMCSLQSRNDCVGIAAGMANRSVMPQAVLE